jgi:hypothetical protein
MVDVKFQNALEQVQTFAKMYEAKSANFAKYINTYLDDPLPDKKKILWYKVGHDNTHHFYLGVDPKGNLYLKSYPEKGWDMDKKVPIYGRAKTTKIKNNEITGVYFGSW